MSVTASIFIGLAMGFVFGIILEKSRTFEPGIIISQMQLKSFVMLKVFLTAVATGAVVIAVLNSLGFVKLSVKPTFYPAILAGGGALGVGIALAGACPGTILAQIGAGYRDAIFTLLGGLAGAVAFSYAEPTLRPLLMAEGPGKITFADLSGLPYWVLALALALALIGILFWLEKRNPWREEIGPDGDGLSD